MILNHQDPASTEELPTQRVQASGLAEAEVAARRLLQSPNDGDRKNVGEN
jgi:hypothetical protein